MASSHRPERNSCSNISMQLSQDAEEEIAPYLKCSPSFQDDRPHIPHNVITKISLWSTHALIFCIRLCFFLFKLSTKHQNVFVLLTKVGNKLSNVSQKGVFSSNTIFFNLRQGFRLHENYHTRSDQLTHFSSCC